MPSAFYLGAVSVAFAVYNVLAAPIENTLEEPKGPRALYVRQAPPADWGSQNVDTIINGQHTQFIHYYGIHITTKDNGDEELEISGPLLDTIKKMIANPDICPASPIKREQENDESEFSIEGRDDTEYNLNDIVLNPMSDCRVKYALGELVPGPEGGWYDLLPLSADAVKIHDYLGSALAELEEQYLSYIEEQEDLGWTDAVVRRAAVVVLIATIRAVELGMTGSKIVIGMKNLKPLTPVDNVCGEEEPPLCIDASCRGVSGACTVSPNLCPCQRLSRRFPPQTGSFDALRAQQLAFAQVQTNVLEDAPAQCYGLGTDTWIIDQAAGKGFIDSFCSDYSVNIDGPFGQGGPNALQLKIQFDLGPKFQLTKDECKTLFYRILDNCDGNDPDNMQNVKHGGTIRHPKGATLSIEPRGNSICNTYKYTKWVDFSRGFEAVTRFCGAVDLAGKAGARPWLTINKDDPDPIYLSIKFTKDITITKEQCIADMRRLLDDCDANDPTNNPDGNKYGGHTTTKDGIVYQVMPMGTPPVFPPDPVDFAGHPIEVHCANDKSNWADASTVTDAINRYCNDGDALHMGEGDRYGGSGFIPTFVHVGSELVDPNKEYQKGASTVCRPHGQWQGKIIRNDCLAALHNMQVQCASGFYNSTYVYNCVKWSLWTNFF